MEELLIQMVSENRALRVLLEQLETPLSWPKGGPEVFGRDVLERSPVSFAPDRSPSAAAVHMAGRTEPGSLRNGDVVGHEGFRGSSDRVLAPASMLMGPRHQDVPHGIPPPPIPPGGNLPSWDSVGWNPSALRREFVPPLPPSLALRVGAEAGRGTAGD